MSAAMLFVAVGCSGDPPKATAEEQKAFGGGPPPANYMDKPNATTKTAQSNPNPAVPK